MTTVTDYIRDLSSANEQTRSSAMSQIGYQNAAEVQSAGGIPLIIRGLTDTTQYVREYALTSLARLATNNAKIQDAIQEAGVIPPLIACLSDTHAAIQNLAASALANLAKNNSRNQDAIREAGGIAPLIDWLSD